MPMAPQWRKWQFSFPRSHHRAIGWLGIERGGFGDEAEGFDAAPGDEFHRAEVDYFIGGGGETGGFHIEVDDGAMGERGEQGVDWIAVLVGAKVGEGGPGSSMRELAVLPKPATPSLSSTRPALAPRLT